MKSLWAISLVVVEAVRGKIVGVGVQDYVGAAKPDGELFGVVADEFADAF